ncbi:MAG: LysM peptidoglycan-binding domain-containing protein [Lentisphaerae bacterium]|nr:LysM peptidoglycan-binding domain-containing protein [Lentisphaerota bacterium]
MATNMMCLLTAILLAGCSTLGERHNARARESIMLDSLESDMQRLKEKVDGLSAAQQDIYEELSALKRQQSKMDEEAGQYADSVSKHLKDLDTKCAGMKQEIVDNLSKKITGILSSGASMSATGREHIVQAGQTLSEIASAYGVQVKSIVSANKLKDANSIKVGQKLFIPD